MKKGTRKAEKATTLKITIKFFRKTWSMDFMFFFGLSSSFIFDTYNCSFFFSSFFLSRLNYFFYSNRNTFSLSSKSHNNNNKFLRYKYPMMVSNVVSYARGNNKNIARKKRTIKKINNRLLLF